MTLKGMNNIIIHRTAFAVTVVALVVITICPAKAYHTPMVIGWPVPYIPGYGVFTVKDYAPIDFQYVKMKIYSIEGEEIYSARFPGYPALWNGRGKDGERVDPGMYIVKIEAENIYGVHAKKVMRILTGGSSRGTFTRGGWVGAKYVAMGRSGEVIADDVYSIYWNPAGLNELRHTKIMTEKDITKKAREGKVDEISDADLVRFSEEEKSFAFQMGMSGTRLLYGGYAGFVGMAFNLPTGVMGIGSYTVYGGSFARRDLNGFKNGELIYLASAFYLSYGVSLGVSSFGFSLKGMYERNGNSSFAGGGVDVGTQVYVLPILKVGLTIQDLGGGMYPLDSRIGERKRYNMSYPTLRLGIALITNRNFTLSVSGIKHLDRDTFGYGAGAEYAIVKWASVYIGINNLVFSAGLTFHVVQYDVSYAFTLDTVSKGFNHTASVAFLF